MEIAANSQGSDKEGNMLTPAFKGLFHCEPSGWLVRNGFEVVGRANDFRRFAT
jgi:hypothetical protein